MNTQEQGCDGTLATTLNTSSTNHAYISIDERKVQSYTYIYVGLYGSG